jgi:uncharacterized protein (TIGR02246 family)
MEKHNDQAEIRALAERWVQAIRDEDFAGIRADHDPNILLFDVPPPLSLRGVDAYMQTWETFFSWSKRSGVFDLRNLEIVAGQDVAFATALGRCAGTQASGERVEANFRLTMGFRKTDGRWRIVHEHHSLPATLSETRTDEQAIATLLKRRDKAHQGKDAATISATYAHDAVRYDLAPPLLHRGMRREEVERWLATWDGPVIIENDDLDITVDGALAVAHGVTRMQGRQGGVDQDLWFRTTVVLKKASGEWRIAHEHTSVPFYMDGSDKAALDLQPETR